MTDINDFLKPSKRDKDAPVPFDVTLYDPDIGALKVKGVVSKSDSKAFKQAKRDAQLAWAEEKIAADDLAAEIISAITSDVVCTIDDNESKVDAKTFRKLLGKYEQLVEAIDAEASKGVVFIHRGVKP